jgi:hypothetical protein
MSHTLGTYSFLPWLRQGLANQIQSADFDETVLVRAEIVVELALSGETLDGGTQADSVSRNVALFGPGDIRGIDSRAIVRVEPRNWITNFEPNYLAHVEFYHEDFPWRYTPATPDLTNGRLRPWIMLAILKEDEFTDGKNIKDRPLPYIDVADPGVFPPAEQLWAWAHVHVNRSLAASEDEFTSNDMGAVLPKLQGVLAQNADLAYSRIVCPRKLGENAAYHAFLVPVFETGRLAGLGLDPANSPHATFSAWAPYPSGTKAETASMPYYHRWFFRTGNTGDFESLVRLLKPKPVDTRVGTRDMDVQAPGSNLPGITDAELKGVLKLGGALRVPRENYTPSELEVVDTYEHWSEPFPHPFQQKLAALINLADDYAVDNAEQANSDSGVAEIAHDPDPVITAPLYGTWHALTKRLLVDRDGNALAPDDNWVHELNLDPRFRVAAGFGTRIVQRDQEKYMDAAWEQIGKVLEANRRIRLGQLAREVSFVWFDRHVRPLATVNQQKGLLMMAPVAPRVIGSAVTVHHLLGTSFVQPAMTSTALRRIIRPRGRLFRRLLASGLQAPDGLLARVNAGEVSAAPPRAIPAVTTVDHLADRAAPSAPPPLIIEWIRRFSWFRWLPIGLLLVVLLLLVLLAPFVVALAIGAIVTGVAVYAFQQLSRWTRDLHASDALREDLHTPEAVDALPPSSDFRLTTPDMRFTPRLGGADSVEAMRFKAALKEAYTLIVSSRKAGAVEPKHTLDLPALNIKMLTAIDPDRTIPKRVMAGIFLPPRIREEIGDGFVEAMAYPEFDTPMYEPLKNLSAELFLPNINLIEQNSITLLETNQKFIESYMVGLNHECGREFLWRGFPTDQRGTPFGQFWDVSGVLNTEGLDPDELREKLRDIPPIHTWPKSSKLGDHDNREVPGETEEEVVLVIRGELLKRYPTAVIYAHRACWQRKGEDGDTHPCLRTGEIDNKRERRLEPLTDEEEVHPPSSKVRTPLYEAKVDPDIYFFGFDLTVSEAQGESGAHPDDDPGWFFVIKERPGEPRFGLDIDQQPALNVWSDLSWEDVEPGSPGSYIQLTDATPSLSLVIPSGPEVDEKMPQFEDDQHVSWNKDMSAADLAYVLLQPPVLVAVHASEMLKRL